jgi:hypothetical protein
MNTDIEFTVATRLPKLGVLTPGTRQQIRRLRRSQVPCFRCGAILSPGRNVLFDDGHDSHADCSLSRNADLVKMRRDFAMQDARDTGRTGPWELLKPMQRDARATPYRQVTFVPQAA